MNDEHGGDTSMNGRSSRTDGASTATAEPVDRRWFEEALRAQGFLVEPPILEDDDPWQEPASVESEPHAVEAAAVAVEPASDDAQRVPEHGAEPIAAEPVAAQAEIGPLTDTQPAASVPAYGSDPAVSSAAWPSAGAAPTRIDPAPTGVRVPVVPGTVTRQAVAPTTLAAAGTSPVPSAALAARLSRASVTAPVALPAVTEPPVAAQMETSPAGIQQTPPTAEAVVEPTPVAAEAVLATPPAEAADLMPSPATEAVLAPPAQDDHPEAIVGSAEAGPVDAVQGPGSTASADPWTLPALQAELAADRPSDATSAPVAVDAAVVAQAPDVALGASAGIVTTPLEDASSAELTARAEADIAAASLAASAAASVAATAADDPAATIADTHPIAGTDQVADADPISATSVPVVSTVEAPTPFAAAATGIAAVAPRPPGTTVGTTVDGGESDLWGLVGDPRKAAAATPDPAVEAPASRITTIALTVIVAFVVVVLVLGFLYLLTNLL